MVLLASINALVQVPVPDKYRGVHRSDEESGRLCETYASYVQRAIVDTHNNNSRVRPCLRDNTLHKNIGLNVHVEIGGNWLAFDCHK